MQKYYVNDFGVCDLVEKCLQVIKNFNALVYYLAVDTELKVSSITYRPIELLDNKKLGSKSFTA